MPRSKSFNLDEQTASTSSSKSTKSAEDMRTSDTRVARKQKKLSKIGRSYSTPVPSPPDESDPDIDLLSPKPNGRTMEDSGENAGENKTTIRWMWKKAFKSLKTKDRDKEKEKEKMRDDRSDKSSEREEKRAYGRMNSRQSSVKKSLLKRKDSKEQPAQSGGELDEEPELTDKAEASGGVADPVFTHLKFAASKAKKPDDSDEQE